MLKSVDNLFVTWEIGEGRVMRQMTNFLCNQQNSNGTHVTSD